MSERAIEHADNIIQLEADGKLVPLTTERQHIVNQVLLDGLYNIKDSMEEEKAEASAENNEITYQRLRTKEEQANLRIEKIIRASKYSGTEISKAMSVRRLGKNREKFSLESMVSQIQDASRSKVSEEELGKIQKEVDKHKKIKEEVIQREFQDQEKEDKENEIKAKKVVSDAGKKVLKRGKARISSAQKNRAKLFAKMEKLNVDIEKDPNFLSGEKGSFSPEILYLAGQVGLTYVQEGIGNVTDIVERIQGHFPKLNLSYSEALQAIISQDPSRKTRNKTVAQENRRNVKAIARQLLKIDKLTKGILPEKKQKIPKSPELKALSKEYTRLFYATFKSGFDATKIEQIRDKIARLQDTIDNGLKQIKKSPRKVSTELAKLRSDARDLQQQINVRDELADLDRQFATGEFKAQPVKIKRKKVSKELNDLQIELAEQRSKMRQMVEDSRPWNNLQKFQTVTAELKAIAATMDMSFAFRQNLWQMFAHPIRNFEPFARAMQAFFSEHSAQSIANSLRNSANAQLYELYGISIMDASSQDAQNRSEVFRGQWIENLKIPGIVPVIGGKQTPIGWVMSASSRHSVAIGNLVRASAFDYFLINNPNATQFELEAISDYINKSTGLGVIKGTGPIIETLKEVMFSPKFAASRFQTPWTIVKYWKMPRVRKQIAGDMTRMLSTGGLILMLASLMGAETEWRDVDSPDWMKIRIDNTRYDIFDGFTAPFRLIARMIKGPFELAEGDFRLYETLGRFASYKVAPFYSFIATFLTNKTVVGEERTKLETLSRAPVPIFAQSVYDAAQDSTEAVVGTIPAEWFGAGANTYRDSYTAAKRRRDNFRSRGWHREADAVVREFNKYVKKGERRLPMQ